MLRMGGGLPPLQPGDCREGPRSEGREEELKLRMRLRPEMRLRWQLARSSSQSPSESPPPNELCGEVITIGGASGNRGGRDGDDGPAARIGLPSG